MSDPDFKLIVAGRPHGRTFAQAVEIRRHALKDAARAVRAFADTQPAGRVPRLMKLADEIESL